MPVDHRLPRAPPTLGELLCVDDPEASGPDRCVVVELVGGASDVVVGVVAWRRSCRLGVWCS